MKRINVSILAILVTASLVLSACAPSSQPSATVKPAVIEPDAGTGFNRVLLTPKAAERLGIQTASVREEQVTRTRTLVGEVVANPAVPVTGEAGMNVGSTNASASGEAFVRVRIYENERNIIDRVQSAQIQYFDDDDANDQDDDGLMADAFDDPAVADDEDDDNGGATLYYKVRGANQALTTGSNVWVEVALAGNGGPQKVVPYAAVLYDLQGKTYVYTSPEPLVFTRQAVTVDYIEGDLAVLVDGPAVGTDVVTVGVAELYGADTGIGK